MNKLKFAFIFVTFLLILSIISLGYAISTPIIIDNIVDNQSNISEDQLWNAYQWGRVDCATEIALDNFTFYYELGKVHGAQEFVENKWSED